MWYVDSSSATLVSWSCSSNRQTSTASAPSVNSAKFVPSPSQVAPSGLGLPGHGRPRGPPNEASGTGGPAVARESQAAGRHLGRRGDELRAVHRRLSLIHISEPT